MNSKIKALLLTLLFLTMPSCGVINRTIGLSNTDASTEPINEPDYFRDAVNNATQASQLAQSATTSEQWSEVADLWLKASKEMALVSESDPNKAVANEKNSEYRENYLYAYRNAKLAFSDCDAYVPTEQQKERNEVDMFGYAKQDHDPRDRSEPLYSGLIGYLIATNISGNEYEQLPSQNWQVPIYEWVGPNTYGESSLTFPHKTKVEVVGQRLRHISYGHYEGFLEVTLLNSPNTKVMINPVNFSPVSYWNCPTEKAVRRGSFLAEILPEAKPVNRDGRWEEPGNERLVFCDKWEPKRFYPRTIGCLMYKQYRNGYGGVENYFLPSDLKIIY